MKTLVVLDNFAIQESIVSAITEAGIPIESIIPCSYQDAGLFVKDASVQLVFIEFSADSPAEAFQLADLIKVSNPVASLVPILNSKDSDLILQLIKRGISDVLINPIDKNELQDIVKKSNLAGNMLPVAQSSHVRGKLVVVTSYKGGTGVSTIAANLGFCLAELDAVRKKTLIVDLAHQSNHCSILLGAQSTITINQICKDVKRMESSYIFSSCAWATPNLAIIGSDPDIGGIEEISFESLKSAFDLFTEAFDYVVVDLPTHCFDSKFLASIDKSNQVLLVSSIDITAIRDSRLYLHMLKSLGVDTNKLRLLINRYDCESGMFKTKDLEQALQSAISFYVPNDFRAITESSQAGQSVLEFKPSSMVAEALAELAIGIDSGAMFVPPKVENKRKTTMPNLGSLFNLKK